MQWVEIDLYMQPDMFVVDEHNLIILDISEICPINSDHPTYKPTYQCFDLQDIYWEPGRPVTHTACLLGVIIQSTANT